MLVDERIIFGVKGYNANTNFEVGLGNINPCAEVVRSLHPV